MARNRIIDNRFWLELDNIGSFARGLRRVPRDYYSVIAEDYQAKSLLDLGCGLGETYVALKGMGIHYAGIDITPNLIEAARKRHPEANFLVGRIQEIPHPDRSFDIASCRCVLEHLPDPDPAIREMARVSTKAVVVVWFKWPGDSEKVKYDKRGFWENAYSRDRILEIMDSVGLRLVDELTVKHHLIWTLEKQ